MFSFVMSVRIFVGKNLSLVKKIVGKKIRHWQKNSLFFADFFFPIRYVPCIRNPASGLLQIVHKLEKLK